MKQTLALLAAVTALATFPALAEEAKTDAPATSATAPAAPAPSAKDYTIVRVGGDEIKNSEVLDIWKGLFPTGAAPDFNTFDENIRQNVLRGIVSERLIYAEAVKAGTDKNEDVKKRLAEMQKQVVIQSFMEGKAKDLVTDDQLRAAYAEKVNATKGQEEIKARHILVANEDEARKLRAELKKGADFEKLAREKSADKGSGSNGGELGWFTKDKMVPEFADAAFKLKKGDISEPVKSPFGWHIIQVEDRRPVQPASFEDMKDSLRSELAGKAVQGYVEGLLKKADIKYYSADGAEKPFTASLSPAAGSAPKADAKKEEKKL
ncbi:MAG: peptidylprolyl isomerase [Pseudomonadota bacterium]|nr:peptidylprolyl isomerase [Pseudomonadota bacterium]